MTKRQAKRQAIALAALKRTLKGIDANAMWKRVLKRLEPKVEAHRRIRLRSAKEL